MTSQFSFFIRNECLVSKQYFSLLSQEKFFKFTNYLEYGCPTLPNWFEDEYCEENGEDFSCSCPYPPGGDITVTFQNGPPLEETGTVLDAECNQTTGNYEIFLIRDDGSRPLLRAEAIEEIECQAASTD